MGEMKLSRDVAAGAETVWRLATDLDRAPEVISGIQRLERLGGGDFGVGTRWRETRVILGKEATEELEVTAVTPGHAYTVEADSRGVHYRSTMSVVPLGAGSSRLEMTFAGHPQGLGAKVLGATIGKLFEGQTRKALQRDLDDLAAAAERSS